MSAREGGAVRVLVTGATGNTGRAVTAELARLGFAVRTAARGGPPPEHRGEHVRFDWGDPSSHDDALAGVDRLYLVAPGLVDDPAEVMVPFLERALRLGARRAVLLSSSAVPEGGRGLGAVHRSLRERWPEWAVLRPSWFMQNFVREGHHHAASLRREGALFSATGEGRVAFVDARDIAAVAARALANEASPDDALLVTGPEALSYGEVAAAIGRASGRPVRHVSVTPEELVGHLQSAGMPEAYARLLADLEGAIRRGEQAQIADTVRRVTGHEARSFEAFAREHASRWA
jgi:uncharacterized protein YbjT (DUF2867 family)